MAYSDEELRRAATLDGRFDRWGGAMGGAVRAAVARDWTVTAYGRNGRPMLVDRGLSKDEAEARAERYMRRADVTRVAGRQG